MDRSIRKLSILGPALAILLAVGLLGPATGVAAPASLAEPAAFEFFVPADQTASDTLTLNNSSAGPLNWGLTLATGGTDLVGNWILDYDWDCAGAPDSLGITFHPELTFTTSEGPSGTWTQTYNQVLLNLPGGTQYTGYIAGQVMTGTMSRATGLAGCWEAGRVIAGPVSLLSGERTASGEPAEAPGTEVAWVVPDPQPVERVTLGEDLQPTAVKEGTGGSEMDTITGGPVTSSPQQNLRPQELAATGGSVLWDLTHGVYLDFEPAGRYSSLTALLNSAGYTVDTTAAGVDSVGLFNYDLLVVNLASNWNSTYTAPEVAAIEAFVRSGGGLLILCDWLATPNGNVNPVAQAFGTTCGGATITLPLTDFAAHPIFAGVSQVSFALGGGLAASPPSELVASDSGGQAGVALAKVDAGQMVAVGDVDLWTNSFLSSPGNQQFAENVFHWLSTSQVRYLVHLPMVVRNWSDAQPIAQPDAYAASGNVGINVPAGNGVLSNDVEPGGALPLAVVSFDATSTGGGDVQVNVDGSFTYDPPPGFEGLDTFSYTLQNADGLQASATVSVQVADMLWFIDNSAAVPGDGRLNSPFNSLAAFEALNGGGTPGDPKAGDPIFLYGMGGGPYTGGLTLETGQVLVGQGATAPLAGISGITLPPFSYALPATGGSRPTIVNASGHGINLAANNKLRGLDLGATSGSGLAGSSVGALKVTEMAIHSPGGGIDIDGGNLAVTLDSLTTSGVAPGIDLTNVSGSFSVPGGAIATMGATGLTLSSSSNLFHTISLSSISSSGGTHGVLLNKTSGSLVVTGVSTIDSAAAAALRFAATSATISFGAVTVTNRHGTGILVDAATGPSLSFGTVTIDNPNNAGGVGIQVQGSSTAVTVASANIRNTRQTVAQTDAGGGIPGNDGDGDAILLKNNSGSFTLNGGTLQNLADHGIDTRNISGNITLSGVTIEDIGINSANPPALQPDGFYGYNFSGSLLVEGSTIRRFQSLPGSRGIEFLNVGTSFTEIRVQNTAIANSGSFLGGDDGFLFYGRGAVNGNIVIRDQFAVGQASHRTTFSGLSGPGVRVVLGATNSSGTLSVDLQNVAFRDAVSSGGLGGVEFVAQGTPTLDVEVRNNTFRNLFNVDNPGAGIVHLAPCGSSRLTAVVDGNTIDGSNSLPLAQGRQGISVITGDLAGEQLQALDVTINNNTIDATAHEAIYLDVRGDALTNTGPGNVRITNNFIGITTAVAQSGAEAVEIRVRDGVGGDPNQAKTVNLLMQNNQVRNADNGATDETVDLDAENRSTLNATVLGNGFTSNGIADNEFEIATEDVAATACLDLRGNTASQSGGVGNGTYLLANLAGIFNANSDVGLANTGTVSTSGTIGTTASCPRPPTP